MWYIISCSIKRNVSFYLFLVITPAVHILAGTHKTLAHTHTHTQRPAHSCAKIQTHKSLTLQRRIKKRKKKLFNIVPFLDQMTQAIKRWRTHLLSSTVLIICYHWAETANAPLMAIILLSAVAHCGWRADTQSHLACRAEIPQPQLNWILKCGVCVSECVYVCSSVGVCTYALVVEHTSVFMCPCTWVLTSDT